MTNIFIGKIGYSTIQAGLATHKETKTCGVKGYVKYACGQVLYDLNYPSKCITPNDLGDQKP